MDSPFREVDVPSINRPLSGQTLRFRLSEGHRSQLIDEELLARGGRSARTLVKEGSLRVTLVALDPGGELREHQADGPITVHVLSGQIQFRAGADAWTLEEGDLLSLGAGVPHAVESTGGGEFLLTVATAVGP